MLRWIVGLLAITTSWTAAFALDVEKERAAQIELAYSAVTHN